VDLATTWISAETMKHESNSMKHLRREEYEGYRGKTSLTYCFSSVKISKVTFVTRPYCIARLVNTFIRVPTPGARRIRLCRGTDLVLGRWDTPESF
jgi:hypothetical protein